MKPLAPIHWPQELSDIRAFLGNPLNIHNVMAHHPELMKAWSPFRNHVVANSSLTPRHRELLILRTALNTEADYEWRHHVERGLKAGLDKSDFERVKQGPAALGWKPEEAALIAAADDCHRDDHLSTKTLALITQSFSTQQQLDIVVTVGMYITLALIIKTWEVPMED
ncbi:MAG: carboxymuconolactone decarboxylase family protein [Gammaproteobacteria bacterium]|nr:carboxymuconolactone decarboxylase family protein [Gammaproteobacteria bacterium]